MATPASPVLAHRRRFGIVRALAFVLIAAVLVLLVAGAWFYSKARSALPQLDGRVKIAGLSAPVTVIRDGHGVPTINAANLDDLFFAQGYVTAQDRLWQMDMMRRFAAGDISEILGEEFVPHDREQRILGLRVAAKKAIEVASAQNRAHFDAYAKGVNAFIESHRDRLPIEFRILRYAPDRWTPEDSTLIASQMVKDLNHYPYRDALDREKILAKLGPELTADLYVNSSWRDRPPTATPRKRDPKLDQDTDEEDQPDRGAGSSVTKQFGVPASRGLAASSKSRSAATSNLGSFATFADFLCVLCGDDLDLSTAPANGLTAKDAKELRKGLRENHQETDPEARMVIGSNNWVVSGGHTVSGKPLLSNDMHLGHQMPNLWFEAHLRCGDFDAAGVTLPGLPYVIVGHNRRIAWGFTNIGPTVEDVYIETFNSAGQYLTPAGWMAPEHRSEVIHVKGKPDVVVDVALTRHGPIITELIPGETRKLALRWILYEGTHDPFFEVDSAQNWDQFRSAFSAFDAPGQNVVFADVNGNIGYQATGKIPIRASGDGSLPQSGSDNLHEWTSYIPFDKLPSVYNPPSGIIATANGRITPDGYRYSISTGWEAPWRSARIYRVLESGKKFSAADMLALQMDIYSEADRFFAERFVYSVDHARNVSARTKQAAEIMRGWDGRMTADSAAPTIAYRARVELTRLLLEPKLGPAPADAKPDEAALNWKSYAWGMQSVWLENVVHHQPQRWLPAAYGNYDDLLAAAVEAAVGGAQGSKDQASQDLDSWKWGAFRPVEIQHPILGRVPPLQRWTGPGIQPQSGSGYTVKAVSRTHGPSERLTVDLSDLDQTTLNLVTGEAGNFLSPYYMDQWQAWYEGYTFKLPFSEKAVAESKRHELVLQ